MNQIKRISIGNVKGKKELNCIFNCFDCNSANLIIAPNGFGKSTIATAFESLKRNKIELKKQDLYNKDDVNKPSLELEVVGDSAGIYRADSSSNSISRNIDIAVINSPVFAKGTSKNFGKFSTNEAVMSVESIVIEEKIPDRSEIDILDMKTLYSESGKIFFDLKILFRNAHDIGLIVDNLDLIKKWLNHKFCGITDFEYSSSC